MLSVILPVYNYDCSQLVKGLARQCSAMREAMGPNVFDFEIIVGDDASTDKATVATNKAAIETVGARYVALQKNIGRARMCNHLAAAACFDYILLMDCDAGLCADDFICRYWADRDLATVVCGALKNPEGAAPRGCELRYRYERHAERQRTVAARQQAPYARFTTFNVLFHRVVFDRLGFDERCTEYGYEDALMGLMLERRGFTVAHTDNALYHNGIDTNESFLKKTETALGVLLCLGEPMQSVAGASRLAHRLERLGMAGVAAWLFRMIQRPLRRHLLGRRPSLLLFNVYKLGFYVALKHEREKASTKEATQKNVDGR